MRAVLRDRKKQIVAIQKNAIKIVSR